MCAFVERKRKRERKKERKRKQIAEDERNRKMIDGRVRERMETHEQREEPFKTSSRTNGLAALTEEQLVFAVTSNALDKCQTCTCECEFMFDPCKQDMDASKTPSTDASKLRKLHAYSRGDGDQPPWSGSHHKPAERLREHLLMQRKQQLQLTYVDKAIPRDDHQHIPEGKLAPLDLTDGLSSLVWDLNNVRLRARNNVRCVLHWNRNSLKMACKMRLLLVICVNIRADYLCHMGEDKKLGRDCEVVAQQ